MEELRRALTTTTNGVANVIPEDLEPTIIQYLYQVSPFLRLVPKKRANGKTHEVALRTNVPEAWVEGELTNPQFQGSTYGRQAVQLKIVRIAGGVSNFAQSATSEFIDLLQAETMASIEAMSQTLEFLSFWGNSSADGYQFDGVDTLISRNADSVAYINGPVELSVLDDLVNRTADLAAASTTDMAFVMSAQMQSHISSLETRVGMDLQTLTYEGGLTMNSYMGIPFIRAPYVRPTATSPAVTATPSGTGSLPAGNYRYMISMVTMRGEQIHGTPSASATSAGAGITLTWTPDSRAKLYKIFRTNVGTVTTDEKDYHLIAVVAGKTYNSNGELTGNNGTFVDNGTYTANTAIHPLAAGQETIFLINFNDANGLSMLYLNNEQGSPTSLAGWIRYMQLGRTRSSVDYMMEAFTAQQLPLPELCTIARGVSIGS